MKTVLTWTILAPFLVIYSIFVLVGTIIVFPFWLLWSLFTHDQDAYDEFDRIWTALVEADLPTLEAYLQTNPEFPNSKSPSIKSNWLNHAVEAGNLTALQWVLDKGGDVNAYDDDGRAPLICAIEDNRCDLVQLLIDHGADVNAKGTLDDTPLHQATVHGDAELVGFLLTNGADPNAFDSDYTPERPIDRARRRDNPDIVRLLEDAMT